jgi:hypothetical protein
MASTINATTSGVVTTGDSVATLSLQTGGTTAVAIDTAQIVSLSKSLALLGSTSGSVTIAAPAVAGTQAYTLPTAQPTANGQALTATIAGVMSWAAAGGGSPGGSDTQVQFNDGGSTFGGDSGLTYNKTTDNLTVLGNLVIGTSGKGIDFSATPGTGTSELLADYEEGTWTPSLGGSTTYSGQVGTYTKIGNLVEVNFSLNITSIGSGSTSQISGLPFTPGGLSTLTGSVGYFDAVLTATVGFFLRIDGGTAAIKIAGTTAAATSVTTSYGTFKNGTVFIGNALFYV